MPDQDIRVTARMQMDGLSEVQARLRPIVGTIREAEEAVHRLNQKMQETGRPMIRPPVRPAPGEAEVVYRPGGGPEIPGRSPILPERGRVPERVQPWSVPARRMGTSEAEIRQAIAERRKALAVIDSELEEIFSKRTPATIAYQRAIDQGYTHATALRRAIAGGRMGSGDMERARIIEPEAQKLHKEIATLEVQADRIGRHVGGAVSGSLNQWLPRFSRVLSTGLGLVGIGGALAIAAQSRRKALDFYNGANEIGFMGFGGSGIRELQEAARRASGLAAGDMIEAQQTGGTVMRGFGKPVDADTIRKFSQLSLYFGMGRGGFANMASEMAVTSLSDADRALKFGMLGAGVAQSAGLSQKERQYFMASNRDHLEQLARFYGGRPVSVEDYFKGVNSMMVALAPLAREGVRLPQLVADISRETLNAISPFGKSPGELIKQAALLGFTPQQMMEAGGGKGIFFGAGKAPLDLMREKGVLGVIQQLARSTGMETGPGAGEYTEQQYNKLFIWGRNTQFQTALQKAFQGGHLDEILRADEKSPPKDLRPFLDQLEKEVLGTQGGGWTAEEIKFTNTEIQTIGKTITNIELELKKGLGPSGAIALAIAAAAAPSAATGVTTGLTAGATLAGLSALGTGVVLPVAAVAGTALALYHLLKMSPEAGLEQALDTAAPGSIAHEKIREQRAVQRSEDSATWISPQGYAMLLQNMDSLRFSVERLTDSMEKNTDETARNTMDRPEITLGLSGNGPKAP